MKFESFSKSKAGIFNRCLPRKLGQFGIAILLMIVSMALALAQTRSTSTPATPGLPRFFVYMSPNGVADDSGEPSIGSNWT
ncbi:MAG TPA: hypothetical protein VFA58_06930, partial [Chthoniobacterales bacterium]|nr:hypothetical protein [Chthoniobacterales bacterium]